MSDLPPRPSARQAAQHRTFPYDPRLRFQAIGKALDLGPAYGQYACPGRVAATLRCSHRIGLTLETPERHPGRRWVDMDPRHNATQEKQNRNYRFRIAP
jgi:hypothetical protein